VERLLPGREGDRQRCASDAELHLPLAPQCA
jgi:hypothetical protein